MASSNESAPRVAISTSSGLPVTYTLRVSFPNIKVGFHTDAAKFGLRAIDTLHEIVLCEFGRVASTSLSGAASYSNDCGLRVASNKSGQAACLESGPVAFSFDDCGL